MIKKYLAPAGTRIKLKHIIKWAAGIFRGDSSSCLTNLINEKFNVRHSYTLSSGRAAFYLLLEALKEQSANKSRNTVIVPSYTCYSVPASIIKAGLVPCICDVNPETLSYDMNELMKVDCQKVLAITASNLYGIPDDLITIEKFASENKLYLIDDAAQAMGANISGRYVGTFGDAGIYSFDKGKNITTLEGGVLVTNNDELAKILETKISGLPEMGLLRNAIIIIKIFLYSILLKPYLYWIPTIIPGTGLGLTLYEEDYHVTKYSSLLAALAYVLFKDLDQINKERIKKATYLFDHLKDQEIVTPIALLADSYAVYPRVALLATNHKIRNELIELMNAAGIGATGSYPQSIADVEEVKHSSIIVDNIVNGRTVANNIITFPTHQYVNEKDLDFIVKLIRNYSDNLKYENA
jgi:dTDP-4-amino-4,6-dideoxygalactose transaminase